MGSFSARMPRRRRCVKAWCLISRRRRYKPCPAVRKKRYLAFAATGGLGNQFYNLKTAVWVAALLIDARPPAHTRARAPVGLVRQ